MKRLTQISFGLVASLGCFAALLVVPAPVGPGGTRDGDRSTGRPICEDPPITGGVTFAVFGNDIFVPAEMVALHLGWELRDDEARGTTKLNGTSMRPDSLRRQPDRTILVSLTGLVDAGATVGGAAENGLIPVTSGGRSLGVLVGPKRIEIDLDKQRLWAVQGKLQVLETRISSGRGGSTPAGTFSAGPYKARRHYSSRYGNAPMPWSIQITGNIFIHGFTSVPDYPASHGCIRVPLDGGNPARFLYEWTDVGTPIRITRSGKHAEG